MRIGSNKEGQGFSRLAALVVVGQLLVLLSLAGCDPVTRQRTLNLLFDGVPDYPPVEQMCDTYHQEMLAAEAKVTPEGEDRAGPDQSSRHLPYKEKRCDSCHDQTRANGLITEERKLCFVCHDDFVQGRFVHGPVSVGDCLACHVPHSSGNKRLLMLPNGDLCVRCHKEKRLAEDMHNKVGRHQMHCTDCHDPHAGEATYFLK